ncbi:signal peptidase I [Aestuariibacter salexigens]|uniref:signal peptidase I n=1 Tax=Aestuariibacter salexigens TaxID=226010 RepID=UPI000404D368|nr:signal peptidase I [Aestuariibacter salexigens]
MLNLIKENLGFITVLCLLFMMRSSFADWYVVPTGSMLPTIVEGDRILVNKMAYRLEVPFTDISLIDIDSPQRGDIVVFNSSAAESRMVKRVIGLPGDRVAMHDNRLYLNGAPLSYQESDLSFTWSESLAGVKHPVQWIPAPKPMSSFAETVVPDAHYLVLGDNRNNSADSRVYGFVPASELQGKALRVLVSLDADNYYLPRADRFNVPLI